MRIGVGLPTHLGAPPDPRLVLDWARLADESGFAALGVHDRPNHWTWEPLAALSAVAVVTQQIRLMTTALLLPTRPAGLVAKQAAVVDHLSGGRLELGLSVGARQPDFDLLEAPFEGRGRRFRRQLEALIATWDAARGDASGHSAGPAPLQEPHPPLWIGGYVDAAPARAARYGVGYIFGAVGSEAVRRKMPAIRQASGSNGRLKTAALAYVAVELGTETARRAEEHLLAYYGSLHRPFEELVHLGRGNALADQLNEYAAAGLDLLVLLPTIPDLEQLQALAGEVLPAFQRRQ